MAIIWKTLNQTRSSQKLDFPLMGTLSPAGACVTVPSIAMFLPVYFFSLHRGTLGDIWVVMRVA